MSTDSKPHSDPKALAVATELATHHRLCATRKNEGKCDCYARAGSHYLGFAYLGLLEQLEALRAAAEVVVKEFADDNPFVGYSIEALEFTLHPERYASFPASVPHGYQRGTNFVDSETGKPVAVNPDTGKWETVEARESNA